MDLDLQKVQPEETAIDLVKRSRILTDGDLAVFAELKDELAETFERVQVFRTRTEMEISVLSDIKHPTPDSKYWQAVREQNVMFTETVMLSYEYRKKSVEVKKLGRQLETESDELERELLQIEIERKTFEMRMMERTAKDRIRELRQWHEIKAELLPQLEHATKDVNDHQLVSYAREFIKEVFVMGNAYANAAEKRNQWGKLQTTLRICGERGLIDKVFEAFPATVREQLKEALPVIQDKL